MWKTLLLALLVVVAVVAAIRFGASWRTEAGARRLTRFEVHAVSALPARPTRISVVEGEPLLVAPEEREGEIAVALLMAPGDESGTYEDMVENVETLVEESGVLALPRVDPDRCFDDRALENASTHVRIAFSDGTRWASVYDPDRVPVEVSALVGDVIRLADRVRHDREAQKSTERRELDSLDANELFPLSKDHPILEVDVDGAGRIEVGASEVTWSTLESLLDELAEEKGGVLCWLRTGGESVEQQGESLQRLVDSARSSGVLVRILPYGEER